ncbi:MAG TPA: 30S ribosomal protein S13 [Bdellovibrionota bacterium]|jgi:small subunit ribosomal protein S13|nr:30S ribosomal protein S13 [Bdellovibrionota bacterium]
MARIAGVDLPRNKRMDVALTYIHGIGTATAQKMLEAVGLDPATNTDQLDDNGVAKIREYLEKHLTVEGDLRRRTGLNIKRLIDLQTYRGLRHRSGLPIRGQRTRSNSRTRKGPRKTVAGKASVKGMK